MMAILRYPHLLPPYLTDDGAPSVYTFCIPHSLLPPVPQYRSGIYSHDEAQKEAALKKINEVNEKLASGAWGK